MMNTNTMDDSVYLSEIKSDDRDKAAAFDDEYKYYE